GPVAFEPRGVRAVDENARAQTGFDRLQRHRPERRPVVVPDLYEPTLPGPTHPATVTYYRNTREHTGEREPPPLAPGRRTHGRTCPWIASLRPASSAELVPSPLGREAPPSRQKGNDSCLAAAPSPSPLPRSCSSRERRCRSFAPIGSRSPRSRIW